MDLDLIRNSNNDVNVINVDKRNNDDNYHS